MMIPSSALVGCAILVVAIGLVLFSPYRRWLAFMFAGMAFWGVLELLRFGMQSILDLSLVASYTLALSLVFVVMTAVLMLEDRRIRRQQQKAPCIEHTPVYEQDAPHASSRS